jgi:hypothetical protein
VRDLPKWKVARGSRDHPAYRMSRPGLGRSRGLARAGPSWRKAARRLARDPGCLHVFGLFGRTWVRALLPGRGWKEPPGSSQASLRLLRRAGWHHRFGVPGRLLRWAVGRPRRAVPVSPVRPDRATSRRAWGSAGPRLLSWAARVCGVRPRDGQHDHSQLGDFRSQFRVQVFEKPVGTAGFEPATP